MNEEEFFPALTIESLIDMLRKFSKDESKIYHLGVVVDYFFKLNPPAPSSEIAWIERECGLILPNEYKRFLMLVDGLRFGNAECAICSCKDVMDFYFVFEDFYPSNMLVIATAAGSYTHILLQVNEDGYKLFVTSAIGDDYMWLLSDDNILTFFDKFISTYGFPFWKVYKDESTAIMKFNVD
ncbi:SMI1/KNR4 family protein [Paenibacillus urinalis]|uniref:SMI1/KNR4 family protein n=1 Tax=Paenibacillus urinalis TaxID=521520 RepID=A0ABY7X9C0_9BACL|nr:SMI1/KNR4 family protein [Paenibacillus urinalis]WDH98715.1 SMI1/KNR4 family protein [Paenibacillus urinalis]WDI02408.1 SMI1/KNR4 family protein [Paenibacillus urinalis]